MPRFFVEFQKKLSEKKLIFQPADEKKILQISEKIFFGLTKDESGNAGFYKVGNLLAVGEILIYNRREIFDEFSLKQNLSDGELLLQVFLKVGISGLNRIEGMFAAVISDGENLFAVRDAVGAKTLFYLETPDGFFISSSLKTLKKNSNSVWKLNYHAVASFLTFAYLPREETLIENVFELLPAHALKISADGRCKLFNYYEPKEDFDRSLPKEFYIAELRRTLEKSVAQKLPETDEKIGIFLSGGIDSSLVAALAAKARPEKINSYSISFGAENPNETAYSSLVASHCRTNHKVLSFSGNQIARHFTETVALLDCPVGDPLTVPNFLLAKAAAEDGLQTTLNGEGGDPCFGGPKNLPMLIFALQRETGQNLSTFYLHSYRKCFDDLSILLSEDVRNELRNNLNLEKFVAPFLENSQMKSYLNRLLYVNIRTKLGHHILPKVERLTSFWNLTGHSPLADKAIVDFSFKIPPELKLYGTIEKWILKESVRDLLPATIIDRPKSGMRVPVQSWLAGALRELSNDLLFGKKARERNLFQEKTVRKWLAGEGLVYAKHGGKIWLLLTLEAWLQSFLDEA